MLLRTLVQNATEQLALQMNKTFDRIELIESIFGSCFYSNVSLAVAAFTWTPFFQSD